MGTRGYRLSLFLTVVALAPGCELAVTPFMLQQEVEYVSCAQCGGDLRRYQVVADSYPTYRATAPILPPDQVSRRFDANNIGLQSGVFEIDAIPIETNDVWRVTHVVDGVYLVQSEQYNQRLCRYSSRLAGARVADDSSDCELNPDEEFGIFLEPDGTVVNGWIGLSSHFLTQGHYRGDILKLIKLEPIAGEISGWTSAPTFIANNGIE